ncbi:hypothetical protein J5N97_003923 [Dioscorea zingiberensis]|uniref:Uncharacterized protein n=1 Tax=Dioscorea zingiberensis TaxID=325984 RepID=A0A9D5D6W4_9LILI|nr:hypothetical protein J5N97_003923 [Dioscorea zingiberensis]
MPPRCRSAAAQCHLEALRRPTLPTRASQQHRPEPGFTLSAGDATSPPPRACSIAAWPPTRSDHPAANAACPPVLHAPVSATARQQRPRVAFACPYRLRPEPPLSVRPALHRDQAAPRLALEYRRLPVRPCEQIWQPRGRGAEISDPLFVSGENSDR